MSKPSGLKNVTLREKLEQSSDPAPAAPSRATNPHYRPGRATKVHLTVFVTPAVKKKLRTLALAQDTTLQALLVEAVNYVFAKNGKPEYAE